MHSHVEAEKYCYCISLLSVRGGLVVSRQRPPRINCNKAANFIHEAFRPTDSFNAHIKNEAAHLPKNWFYDPLRQYHKALTLWVPHAGLICTVFVYVTFAATSIKFNEMLLHAHAQSLCICTLAFYTWEMQNLFKLKSICTVCSLDDVFHF